MVLNIYGICGDASHSCMALVSDIHLPTENTAVRPESRTFAEVQGKEKERD
jgi:hypothetical protein